MQLNENSLIETMFDVMPFAVYVVDVKNLEIVHMNRVMVRRRRGNHSGQICHKALYEMDSRCIHCKMDDILDRNRKPNGISITYEHFDEMDDCWYQIQEKAITWPDGRVVKCSIAVDISDLKEMQNHLAEAHAQLALKNKELEDATRHKSEFLANISHEIRTPLNAVIGLSDLALKTELTLQQEDYLKKIHSSSASLLRILNDLLDFSKIEAGRIDLEYLPFELPQVLDEIFGIFYHAAFRKSIELLLCLDESVPRFVVGDPFRLGQILSNLISNALKFTDSGQILINVNLTNKTDQNATIRFSVSDTGIGIAEEVVPNLFKSFTQADSSTTRKYGGTGLGLAICKNMVELMNGTIWVESIHGKGSTFAFEIDLDLNNKELSPKSLGSSWIEGVTFCSGEIKKTDSAKRRGVEPVEKEKLYLKQILLVDDNSINLQVAKELLEHVGAVVHTAFSGKEAVEQAVTKELDAILMDVNMPGMDGYEATRLIRSHLLNIPVIAMTAFSGIEERRKAVESGMNDFIGKPIDPDLLYYMLIKWVSENRDDQIERKRYRSFAPDPDCYSCSDTDMDTDTDQVMKYFEMVAAREAGSNSSESLLGEEIAGARLNTDSGIRRLAGNLALYQELLNQYIHDTIPRIDELKQAVRQGNWEHAGQVAHHIKGVSGNIGLDRVFHCSSQLEKLLTKRLHDTSSGSTGYHAAHDSFSKKRTKSNDILWNRNSGRSWELDSKVWELYLILETEANQAVQLIESWLKISESHNGIASSTSVHSRGNYLDKDSDTDKVDSAIPAESVEAEFKKLYILLKESNTKAMEQIDVVMSLDKVASLQDARTMATKISAIEFDAALDLLKIVAAQLSISI